MISNHELYSFYVCVRRGGECVCSWFVTITRVSDQLSFMYSCCNVMLKLKARWFEQLQYKMLLAMIYDTWI
jgi:hypothetical protein